MASPAYNPPLPPDVLAQQAVAQPQPSPLEQFAAMGGPSGGFDPNAFLQERLMQVATLLKEVNEVLTVEKPGMIPILEVMLKAGSSLMGEIQKDAAQTGPAPPADAVQPQAPQPTTPAGAVSMG